MSAPEATDPIREVVLCIPPEFEPAFRDQVAGAHAQLSRGARQASAMDRHRERGVFSIEFGRGSRPGSSDATFVPRSDYLRVEPGMAVEEYETQNRILMAIDASDPASEYVLCLIVGQAFAVAIVKHGEDRPDGPDELIPQIV